MIRVGATGIDDDDDDDDDGDDSVRNPHEERPH
jgi:hypothetical protein